MYCTCTRMIQYHDGKFVDLWTVPVKLQLEQSKQGMTSCYICLCLLCTKCAFSFSRTRRELCSTSVLRFVSIRVGRACLTKLHYYIDSRFATGESVSVAQGRPDQ